MPPRVIVTPEAAALIVRLKQEYGPLVFHQSGGCCEGSAPMCFRQRDFIIGRHDVLLGVIEGCPFYVGGTEFAYWAFFELTIEVTHGGGDSFSDRGRRWRALCHPFTIVYRCRGRFT